MRLWCFFRILTSPVYARIDQCTSSSISPWKSTNRLRPSLGNLSPLLMAYADHGRHYAMWEARLLADDPWRRPASCAA